MVACNDDGPSTSTSTSTGQLTSDVWKHFTKYDDQPKAMCSLCGKGITYRGGTTNLINHLHYKNPLIYSSKDKTAKGLGKKNRVILTQSLRLVSVLKQRQGDYQLHFELDLCGYSAN